MSPVMVGAEGASPEPTWPSAASMRTIRFSALAIVIPAIFIGALSGNAIGMASIRRTINGAISAVEPIGARVPLQHGLRCLRCFRLDVRRLDDWRPLVHLGLVERAEACRRHLLGGGHFLANLGEPFVYRRIGERTGDRGIEFDDHSFGVPFGAHTPCQIET